MTLENKREIEKNRNTKHAKKVGKEKQKYRSRVILLINFGSRKQVLKTPTLML